MRATRKHSGSILDEIALSKLQTERESQYENPPYAEWIRILRRYLRMTQAELAERCRISQPHLAAIESGKTDPQITTLKKIFQGLSCDTDIVPRPQKPLAEVLRGRARSLALKRLKQTMGTMSLEEQAPEKDAFRLLLEKRTDEILNDPRERLWQKKDV